MLSFTPVSGKEEREEEKSSVSEHTGFHPAASPKQPLATRFQVTREAHKRLMPGTHTSDKRHPAQSQNLVQGAQGGRWLEWAAGQTAPSLQHIPGRAKMSPWCLCGFGGNSSARQLGVCKPSELEGLPRGLGISSSVQSDARCGKPNHASWVPTWDVEVARRLLVGAGGRLAV